MADAITPTITRTQAWVLASRPKTLPAAVSPVLVGAALAAADGRFAPGPALACLLAALLLQIGSNLANDYFDHVKGADTADRVGPLRVTAGGLLTPAQVRGGMIAVFGLAALDRRLSDRRWRLAHLDHRRRRYRRGGGLYRRPQTLWLHGFGRHRCLSLFWPGRRGGNILCAGVDRHPGGADCFAAVGQR